MSAQPPLPDEQALLAGLVLSPAVYARNQRFELYQRMPRARALRARAARLRGCAKQWLEHPEAALWEEPAPVGVRLSLQLPQLAYRQTLLLDAFERALLAYLFDRAVRERAEAAQGRTALQLTAAERALIDAALLRLSQVALTPRAPEA